MLQTPLLLYKEIIESNQCRKREKDQEKKKGRDNQIFLDLILVEKRKNKRSIKKNRRKNHLKLTEPPLQKEEKIAN